MTQLPTPFDTPARAGEIILVEEVFNALCMSGLNAEAHQVLMLDHYIKDSIGKCFEAQRFLLNRFWHLQLQHLQNSTGVKTIDERFCLIESGDPALWLRFFKEKILPVCIEHRLPKVI